MLKKSTLLLLLWLALCLPAGANMANPVRAGDPVGEPSGALKAITIEREMLAIDLRPLARGRAASPDRSGNPGVNSAVVEAVYRVNNGGPARRVDLVFVANALRPTDLSGVWVNNAPVAFRSKPLGTLPETWKAPATTPGLGRAAPFSYETDAPQGLTFTLPLATGSNTVRVRYAALPTARSGDSPTVYWQLGYVLAPARNWGGFGGLDVVVYVPHGWRAASDPALKREGDTLRGTFDAIPADALGLTVQAPPPSAPDTGLLAGIAGLLVCVGGGWAFGRWLGRRGKSIWWALPVALVLAAAYAVAFLIAAATGPSLLAERAGEQSAWTYGYGRSTAGVLLSPLVFLVGLVAAQASAWFARRRSR